MSCYYSCGKDLLLLLPLSVCLCFYRCKERCFTFYSILAKAVIPLPRELWANNWRISWSLESLMTVRAVQCPEEQKKKDTRTVARKRETAKCCYYWTWNEWEIIATWFSHSMIMKSITHRSLLLDKGLWRFFFRRILDLPLHSFIYFIRDAQLHSLHYYCWRSFSKWGNSISFLYFPGRTNGVVVVIRSARRKGPAGQHN